MIIIYVMLHGYKFSIKLLPFSSSGKKNTEPSDVVGKPYGSMSFQVAPGVLGERPLEGHFPKPGLWYEEGLEYGSNTSQNIYFYGAKLEHDVRPSICLSRYLQFISFNHL